MDLNESRVIALSKALSFLPIIKLHLFHFLVYSKTSFIRQLASLNV